MIDGGSTVTVIELRVAEIRLGIEVPRRFPLAKSRKDPWRLGSGKIAPSLMWVIDGPS
jgi:hypothetical protein